MSPPPFRPRSFKPKPMGEAVGAVGARVELPPIRTMGAGDAEPSLFVHGPSGSGKTKGIADLLEAGHNVLVLAVEAKMQRLMRYDPQVIFVGEPVGATGALRAPTPTEMYNRLQTFVDRLGSGDFREHGGKPFSILAVDGAMEVGHVYARHFKSNVPVSKTTGERNTFAMYDEIGDRLTDFFVALRDAASAATKFYGVPPIGIYVTCGEKWVEGKPGQPGYWRLALPGNKAPDLLPYSFETSLRLSVRRDETSGVPLYVAHTVGEDGLFDAKAPSGLFPTEILQWNMAEIYETLRKDYRGEEVTAREKESE